MLSVYGFGSKCRMKVTEGQREEHHELEIRGRTGGGLYLDITTLDYGIN